MEDNRRQLVELRYHSEASLEAGEARVAGPGGHRKEPPLRRDHFLTKLPSTEPDLTNAALISTPPENVTGSSTVAGFFNLTADHMVDSSGLICGVTNEYREV
ncbi:hypothetical protein N9B65_06695 [Akkermansiaceae bacterium]|nr:hypothetical protein [Akkermansiaceae bacterium]